MPQGVPREVTRLLDAIRDGDAAAPDQLLPIVYDELRALARARMANLPPGQTLQPTALVHEAYLKLIGPGNTPGPAFDNRAHFFAAAARAMRNILVDQARRKSAVKHGGEHKRVDLTPEIAAPDSPSENMLDLDRALSRLEAEDSRKAQVVMLRVFCGLTSAQTASVLGVSLPTVERDWRFARSWLQRELKEAGT